MVHHLFCLVSRNIIEAEGQAEELDLNIYARMALQASEPGTSIPRPGYAAGLRRLPSVKFETKKSEVVY